MPSALDVMKQIWEQENIYVEINYNKCDLPRYKVAKKYPKNRKISEWINSRLLAYDRTIITVKRGNDKPASENLTIESLKKSYTAIAIDKIENKFRADTTEKKLKKAKVKEKEQIKVANQIKGVVTEISGKKLDFEEIVQNYTEIDKYVKYICSNMERKIKNICEQNGISSEISNKISLQLKEELLLVKIEETLTKITNKIKKLEK